MSYTLLGAPTLGFDLVRASRGAQVASLLLTALSLQEKDLAQLAAVHPGRVRQSRWTEAILQSQQAGQANRAALTGTSALGSPDAAKVLLRQLEISRLGTAESLDRMVRHEVLDWTWSMNPSITDHTTLPCQTYLGSLATDVIADAIIASYGHDQLDQSLAQQLAAPLAETRLEMRDGHPLELPVITSQVIMQLSDLDPAGRRRLLAAVDAARPETARWAPAMHEATWAAHLSGRVRTAATAQLLAVRAFVQCGFTARDGAYGAWNAISGVIQASVVADLLSVEHVHRLTQPWVEAAGPLTGWNVT